MKILKTLPCFFICLIMFMCGCDGGDKTKDTLPQLPEGAQAISLLGDTLYVPELQADVRNNFEQKLLAARTVYESDPKNADTIIWLGRRTAYLGQYRQALNIFTKGIEAHPQDARMYRHRGHRYISIRQLSRAIEDFEHAVKLIDGAEDEIEPDGLPNSRNIPTSTLHSNIWYHLGLAYYLKNDMEQALRAYRECLSVSNNPDMLAASSHWLYMILRRLGKVDEAAQILEPIHADMDIIENQAYHQLLLFYKGEITLEYLLDNSYNGIMNAAIGYGVGNWYYYNGKSEDAKRVFQQLLQGKQWTAFGYIAAEADFSREFTGEKRGT